MVLSTGIDSGKEKKCDLFSIQITTTVKKANLAAEPHGSPLQGCTVRPREGAGQSSMEGREGI
jgi:hypothetical protein